MVPKEVIKYVEVAVPYEKIVEIQVPVEKVMIFEDMFLLGISSYTMQFYLGGLAYKSVGFARHIRMI
jgi:hypothetical protein